ncbi:inositol monophosphatase family protein [Patescibacteria group bacterium]
MLDNLELNALLGQFELNGHIIGIILKELVRRAVSTIRTERFIFEAQAKEGYSGKLDDIVTSADRAAQAVYVKSLRECFPAFGIVAEEENLRVNCTHPSVNIYFTVDPLDGTKAFSRRQSHGIGTMIALVCSGHVIAAYVGDVMTQEIYGFRPGSEKVHRVSESDFFEQLTINPVKPLVEQIVILRELPSKYPEEIRNLIDPGHQDEKVFRNAEVMSGSIGTTFARLWKGEAVATVYPPHHYTPWDMTPILGISEKLGFLFLRYNKEKNHFEKSPMPVSTEVEDKGEGLFVIHEAYLSHLNSCLA